MKKVVLIIAKGLPVPSVKGGAVEMLANIIANINEKEKKVDLTIISSYDELAAKESLNYKYTKFIYIKSNTLSYLFKSICVRIANLFRKEKLNTYNEVVINQIKSKKFDFVIFEGGAFDKYRNLLKYYDQKQLIFHLHSENFSNKVADETLGGTISPSEYIKNQWQKSSNIKKNYVLKNVVDRDLFDKKISAKEKKDLKLKLGFKSDDIIIGFYGRIVKVKGVKELIQAFKKIGKDNVKMLIVGSYNFGSKQTSKYTQEIIREVEQSNGKIIATGYIPNEILYKYIGIMDICVFPSLWEEAALLALVEAMICKKAIIATKSGGNVEFASEESVLFVDKDKDIIDNMYINVDEDKAEKLIDNLYNNIIKLINDSSMKEAFENNAYKESKVYNKYDYYKNFINILDKIGEENEI